MIPYFDNSFFLKCGRREFLLRVEIPLTNTEGMIKLEQYHLVIIIIVVTHSAKTQWILKAVGESLSSYRIFTVSKYLPTRHLLITEGKSSDFTLEKPGSSTSLHHVVEARITRNETRSHPVPPERMTSLLWNACQKSKTQVWSQENSRQIQTGNSLMA